MGGSGTWGGKVKGEPGFRVCMRNLERGGKNERGLNVKKDKM